MFAVGKNEINELVKKELGMALHKWGKHNSHHEKYAVIKEEVEESENEFGLLKSHLQCYWESIKYNNADNDFTFMRQYAMKCILELIQVIAMIDKGVK